MKIARIKRERKKELPEQAVCRNCKTKLISRYCQNCGQDFFSGSERSMTSIISSAFDTLFAWDSKIWITSKYLLLYPGRLTNEYFSGKIVRYVHPFKLFWFLSFIFFALTISTADKEISNQIETVKNTPSKENLDTIESSEVNNIESDHELDKIMQIFNTTKSVIFSILPYITLALIPIFALLLKLFFRNKKFYYASHMIFSLHFFTFTFILFLLLFMRVYTLPNLPFINHILYLCLLVYFVIAIKKVYTPSIPEMIWKLPLFALMYFTLLMFIIISILLGVIFFANQIVTGNIS